MTTTTVIRQRAKSNDDLILAAVSESPSWMTSVLGRLLVGDPDFPGCAIWPGACTRGYGSVRLPSPWARDVPPVYVHRAVWLALCGPIEEGLLLDHDGPSGCSNKACANPAHLQAVTPRHNTVITGGNSVAAICFRRTHCPRGHPLAGDNLRRTKAGRRCRTCDQDRAREAWRAIRLASAALGLNTVEYIALYGQNIKVAKDIIDAHHRRTP